MKTQTDKTQESKNSITPTVTSESSDGGTAQLMDNRTSTIDQRKLRSGIDSSENTKAPIQRKNNTGLPDNLKSGIENLSGYSMDDVKVHYNSNKPAQLQAHAYAQGTDIHLASGQEKYLPHEAWHVVQQKQGRVQPTMQFKGKVNINDDVGLEKEADVMGRRSLNKSGINESPSKLEDKVVTKISSTYQLAFDTTEDNFKLRDIYNWINEDQPEWSVIKNKVYKLLGAEEDSYYRIKDNDRELVKDTRLTPQGLKDVIARHYHKALDNENDEEAEAYLQMYNKVINRKVLSNTEKESINEKAYDEGGYFHIHRRRYRGEKTDERIIVNINSMEKAAELIKFIADGWDNETNDWRDYIISGKFLGTKRLKKHMKYDKVVLYYDKRFQNEIFEGVRERVPREDRNRNISGFYNKLARGIGVGEELGGGTSFTGNRRDSLVKWIMDEGFPKLRGMSKEDFVAKAREVVENEMSAYDLESGSNHEHIESIENNLDDFIENA
ncbi:eCIS core domain-containing protein [Aquimarina macrocephali]|uniref:eCIS core domain-containing protein n=1 Tax=Aquimarina macrocephali TaxID=666563 RepID=UPI000463CE92|nr:DUF4157 domain-containing protein [Aquimarina macrocephali]